MIFTDDHTREILDMNKPETWTVDSEVQLKVFTFVWSYYEDWDFRFVLAENTKEAVDSFIAWCDEEYSYYEKRTFLFEDNEDTVTVTLDRERREYSIIDHGKAIVNQVYG